jgi:dihydroorotate dehydrogenase (fumarate)
VGPELYLDHIAQAKNSVGIPIIGSLNAARPGGWIRYARQVQQAGADALELSIYDIPTEMDRDSSEVEQVYLDILKALKSEVLSDPSQVESFSATPNMARRFDEAARMRWCSSTASASRISILESWTWR